MTVYILFSSQNQDDFTDRHGESAMPYREIIGVYESFVEAERALHKAENHDDEMIRELGTDPTDYEIVRYTVGGELIELPEVYPYPHIYRRIEQLRF